MSPIEYESPDDGREPSENDIIYTPTPPTRPQPVTLICVRCETKWTHPHDCDVISGETMVRVIRDED